MTQILVPDMCKKHQGLMLVQVGIGPDGPWRSAIIAVQIALFQGATSRQGTHAKIDGDITRIAELGCLACFVPDVFGECVQAFIDGGIGATKALGEQYVSNANGKD